MENLLRLTAEQFDRLDELEENDRCLLTGAAGTGKTMLAMETQGAKPGRDLVSC